MSRRPLIAPPTLATAARVNTRRERRLAVEALMLAGARPAEIARQIGERFQVSAATVKRDLSWVRAEFQEAGKGNREAERQRAIRRIKSIAAKAEAKGDFASVLVSERLIAQFSGYDKATNEPETSTPEETTHNRRVQAVARAMAYLTPEREAMLFDRTIAERRALGLPLLPRTSEPMPKPR